MIYRSESKKDTQKIASDLAAKMNSGIIALEGELGAGKTTFAQSFIKALGVRTKVKSPTFNLVKRYKVPRKEKYIYHIDCYRLRDHKDAATIELDQIFKDKDSYVLIEWPERVKKALPKKLTRVHIDHIGENKRKITIK